MAPSSELLQGTLDLLILRTLAMGPMHGWDCAAYPAGFARGLAGWEGSLYPALHRLEYKGWIKAEWGPSENNRRAKYYSLIPEGQGQHKAERNNRERMAEAIGLVLNQVGVSHPSRKACEGWGTQVRAAA
jgi:transcriptional regulator